MTEQWTKSSHGMFAAFVLVAGGLFLSESAHTAEPAAKIVIQVEVGTAVGDVNEGAITRLRVVSNDGAVAVDSLDALGEQMKKLHDGFAAKGVLASVEVQVSPDRKLREENVTKVMKICRDEGKFASVKRVAPRE